ncbi:RidA family protein [Parenemella sanctibonifatiensis]|uniref:LysR family transcriptional regulator n=1 Tax=Parenemella sanctibonifatiensis TaxID=2016505 RepID=A0A255ET99_9ACTN|nr:RidA family protein [Parenemella sanctibonifatiensis]OYN92652.1 LysR family transcriptional regulator [Parenemella sanctibonifatiensis]
MSTPTERLEAAGLELPVVAKPVAAYIPAVVSGGHVWTSGQLATIGGKLEVTGTLGADVDVEEGARQARICALNGLAAAAQAAGGLDNIKRIVKVVVFVQASPDFEQHALVGNGASELLGEVFPDGHARSAVGMVSLPLNAPVEVELVAELT